MSQVQETLQDNWELLKLIIYFGVMVGVAGPLFITLGEAWRQASFSQAVFGMVNYYLSVNLEEFAALAFGFFIGLLILVTLDPKKRWQGILLWIGLVVSLIGLQSIGLFLPNIDLVAQLGWIVGGTLVGAAVGGGRKLTQIQTAEALEFRRASKGIFYLLTVVVFIGLLEFHINYPNLVNVTQQGPQIQQVTNPSVGLVQQSLVSNLLLSGTFLVTLNRFIEYDAEQKFFVLGPKGSGKSLFLIGAYTEALEDATGRDSQTPMNPSKDLMKMVEQLDMDTRGWVVDATAQGEVKTLDFRFIHGTMFPKNIEISSLDYAGEYLSRISAALTGLLENEEDQTLLALARNVMDSDTLILLIDCERFERNEPLEISAYFDILQACENKEVMLVATKADVLAERFQDEEGLEAHRHFDDFQDYVERLLRNNQQVRALIEETARAEIQPVYYETKSDEHGGRVPMRDEFGNVMTVGYDRLMKKLG